MGLSWLIKEVEAECQQSLERLELAVGVEDAMEAPSVLSEELVMANRGSYFCCVVPATRIVLEGSSGLL